MLVGCIALSAYFTYHTVSGRYGLQARDELLTRTTALDFETESLNKVVAKLSNEISLLSQNPPSADIVDEIARDLLGYANPRDRIVMVR